MPVSLVAPLRGPRPAILPVPGGAAACRLGVLPMPDLAWNEQVARETDHLYARVRNVVPSVEWPFFAPS